MRATSGLHWVVAVVVVVVVVVVVAAVLPRAVSQSTMSRHSKNFCEFSLYKCM